MNRLTRLLSGRSAAGRLTKVFPALLALWVLSGAARLSAEEPAFRTDGGDEKLPWFKLQPGQFPPAGSAHAWAGELIALDHVNRTGALRQDRNGLQRTDEYDKSISFTMLPYGSIRYHGAPAELRDIPIGTHLHSQSYLDPKGDLKANGPFGQVLSLADDFSFFADQQRLWRVDAVALDKGTISLTGVGPGDQQDPKPTTFQINRSARIWKGTGFGALTDLAVGQLVLANFTVCTIKGPGRCTDVWIDEESRKTATARQIDMHVHYQREHGLPALIEAVDNQQAIVTATLLGVLDPSLTEHFKAGEHVRVAVADDNLRTHDQINDSKGGPILSAERAAGPPGSAGVRITFKPEMLLEGFRPKRIVRLWVGWSIDDLPREEKLYQ